VIAVEACDGTVRTVLEPPGVTYSSYNQRPLQQRTVTRVQDPSQAWFAQEEYWILIEDLLGGTAQMRKRHRKYLPQEPREADESYDNRLMRPHARRTTSG
jgi:hypothetical protein